MKRVFTMKGAIYSTNKLRIKGLLKLFKLKWVGSQYNAEWKSEIESIKGEFDRRGGVTVEARLIYQGPGDTEFIKQFSSMILRLGASAIDKSVESQIADIDTLIKAEMGMWDIQNRPNVEGMKRPTAYSPNGASEEFIEASLRDYNKKRIVKVEQVRKQLMKDFKLKKDDPPKTEKEEEQQNIEDILGS